MIILKYIGFWFSTTLISYVSLILLKKAGAIHLADTSSAVMLGVSLSMVTWLYITRGVSIFHVFSVLGIPLALLGAIIGVVGLSIGFIDTQITTFTAEAAARANTPMLSITIYGALISLIGFYFHNPAKARKHDRASLFEVSLIVLSLSGLFLYSMSVSAGINAFFDIYALFILTILCLISIYSGLKKNKGICESLADAATYSCVLCLAIGLSSWYTAGLDPTLPAIRFICLALLYSLIIYVFSYVFSFYTQESEKIDYSIKNWHLVETFAFFVFLVFAPISISDYLYNEKENIEQRAVETDLRKEIKNLSERLEALEKVS